MQLYGKFGRPLPPAKGNTTVFFIDSSFGDIKKPREKYSPLGVHADAVEYFVEGRAKVIFVAGKEGMPF